MDIPAPVDAGAAFSAGPVLAVVDADGATVLLVPASYAGVAEDSATADRVVVVEGFGHFEPVEADSALLDALETAAAELGLTENSVAAVDPVSLPFAVRNALPGSVVDGRPAVRSARLIKSDREIDLLSRAAEAADAAQDAIAQSLQAGQTELDLHAIGLRAAYEVVGAASPTAIDIVSGPRTARLKYPGGPVRRTLERGDTVIVDFGVRHRGYWSDTCNTLVVGGEPSDEQLLYANAAAGALAAAVESLAAGASASAVDAAACEALARAGLKPWHYTGHQLGVSVNEDPRLVAYDHTEIEPGMVFAIEPGAYAGEGGSTGARAERMVLVEPDGPTVLSGFGWGMPSSRSGEG
jgi:Xaa-Pro aminopeptidase